MTLNQTSPNRTDHFIICHMFLGLMNRLSHFAPSPLWHQLCSINNFQNEGNLLARVPEIGRQTEKRNDGGDKVSENRGKSTFLTCKSWHRSVFVIRCWRRKRHCCCWQKACIMGYLPILLNLLPAPSETHWGSQSITAVPFEAANKRILFCIVLGCACPALWPAVCPLLVITAYSRYCMTPHSKV